MGIAIVFVLFGALFCADNQDFLETVKKQKAEGYEWHYIGQTPPDPKAKSITIQVKGEEPFVLWKLKK